MGDTPFADKNTNWAVIHQCHLSNSDTVVAQLALFSVRELGGNTTMPFMQL